MNRAMLLTANGTAAIAVIRIAGPAVGGFLRECFDRPVVEGRCAYGRIIDGQRIVDDAVVVAGRASADLSVHGGLWIVHEVLALLQRRGFEIIQWTTEQTWAMDGETELDREIAASLPLARTELALRILLNQSQAWRLLMSAQPPKQGLEKILADRALERLLNPPSVAIIGLPNVGKSTLANQLFGQDRSITADLPGTTRDWVGELANIEDLVVKLIDTPGQRAAADNIEDRAIEAAMPVIASADLVVLVLDPTQQRQPQDELARRWPKALTVINKSDVADWTGPGIRTIATRGIGIAELGAQILRRFGLLDIDENAPRCWTPRQRDEIDKILRYH